MSITGNNVMVKIVDNSITDFLEEIKRRKLYIFGAGLRTRHLYEAFALEGKVCRIIDNHIEKYSMGLQCGKEIIEVIDFDSFITDEHIVFSDIVILITPAYYAWDIINQMDNVDKLDNVRCYIGEFLLEHYEIEDYEFTQGNPIIPKKIHYCWFGYSPMPKHLQKYIDGWKEKCPDYEIIRWDESNYDINKVAYMREAYECGKWGFVPDYARLDIIYNEGGIYLDTDIEVLSSLDKLLCDEMFCSAIHNSAINLGQGFGAIKGHWLIKELRDYYNDFHFCNNGKMNLDPCYIYQNPVFIRNNYIIENRYQKRDGVVVYPSDMSAPTGMRGTKNNFTRNTLMIHHSELSWVSDEEKESMWRSMARIEERVKLSE